MIRLTTHVLDATSGTPAENVAVSLARHPDGGAAVSVAVGITDSDGRLALEPETLEPGVYALTFATGAWFAERGIRSFYPFVTVTVTVDGSSERVHVPLLLSPFAYSTYRGS